MLQKIGYNPEQDQLILLGDYMDRGKNSRQVVEQVMSLQAEWGVIVLKGNHDDMMVKALLGHDESLDSRWLRNGAYQTLKSYCEFDSIEDEIEWDTYLQAKDFLLSHYKHHINFLNSLPLYYETESHIFVHAGINPCYEDWKNQPYDDFIWIREDFFNHSTSCQHKTVVFGHSPCINLHDSSDIWFSPNGDKIGIDGACVYGHQMNCLEINEEGYQTYMVSKEEQQDEL